MACANDVKNKNTKENHKGRQASSLCVSPRSNTGVEANTKTDGNVSKSLAPFVPIQYIDRVCPYCREWCAGWMQYPEQEENCKTNRWVCGFCKGRSRLPSMLPTFMDDGMLVPTWYRLKLHLVMPDDGGSAEYKDMNGNKCFVCSDACWIPFVLPCEKHIWCLSCAMQQQRKRYPKRLTCPKCPSAPCVTHELGHDLLKVPVGPSVVNRIHQFANSLVGKTYIHGLPVHCPYVGCDCTIRLGDVVNHITRQCLYSNFV